MNVTIKKTVEIEIKGQKIELTVAEAEQLSNSIRTMLNLTEIKPIPEPFKPSWPYVSPNNPQFPYQPPDSPWNGIMDCEISSGGYYASRGH